VPLTIAHPVAVLPLRRPLGRLGVPAALVVGSVIPDLPLFLPLGLGRSVTHSAVGLLWFCLPVGVLAYLLYDRVLDRPLRALMPEGLQRRLARVGRAARPPVWSPSVLVSLLIGAATHSGWDAFTHTGSAGVEWFPALETRLFTVSGYIVYVFSALQHLSSAAGTSALAVWIWRWYRQAPQANAPEGGLTPGTRGALLAIIALVVVTAAVAAAVSRPPLDTTLLYVQPVVRRVVVTGLASLVAAVTVYAVGWHWLRRRV